MMALLPPYAQFLGVTVERTEDGTPLFHLPYSPTVTGRPGFVHGGAVAGLLEIAGIGTLLDVLRDTVDTHVKPITVTVDYMRGVQQRETLAAARIERLGRRIANVEVFAWQESRNRPVAAARINLKIRRPGEIPTA